MGINIPLPRYSLLSWVSFAVDYHNHTFGQIIGITHYYGDEYQSWEYSVDVYQDGVNLCVIVIEECEISHALPLIAIPINNCTETF